MPFTAKMLTDEPHKGKWCVCNKSGGVIWEFSSEIDAKIYADALNRLEKEAQILENFHEQLEKHDIQALKDLLEQLNLILGQRLFLYKKFKKMKKEALEILDALKEQQDDESIAPSP